MLMDLNPSQQHVGPQSVVLQLQQEVIKLEPTFDIKFGMHGGAIGGQNILVSSKKSPAKFYKHYLFTFNLCND